MADSYREALVGCLVTLRALRVHCPPTLTIRHLEIAIWIFLQSGITRKDLSRLLPELSEPSLRKYISDLQKTSWRDSYGGACGKAQFNLVKVEERESDYRYKHLHLTDTGHEMMKTIAMKMADVTPCVDIESILAIGADGRTH